MRRGNCYYASEALYHIMGGKAAGWTPQYVVVKDGQLRTGHWFLKHSSGLILDPSARQFKPHTKVPYDQARGNGFLTKRPSRAAQALIETLTWQD